MKTNSLKIITFLFLPIFCLAGKYPFSFTNMKNIDFNGENYVEKRYVLPTLDESECTESFYFSNAETKANYVYNAQNTIICDSNYATNTTNNELVMKAGKTIVLKPGTTLSRGSLYLARIEPCQACLEASEFNFPIFFSPNGDGVNDKWPIGMNNSKTTNYPVFIFDRYGKLIKTLTNDNDLWDGTYNGHLMFSDDYWFKLEYLDCNGMLKEYKSHLTLIR